MMMTKTLFDGLKVSLLTSVLCASVASGGSLGGMLVNTAATNQDLTAEGTGDWAIWGFEAGGTSTSLIPDVRSSTGFGISDLVDLSNGTPLRGLGQFGEFAHSFDWSNGAPTAMETGALGGLQHETSNPPGPDPVGEGFSFTVPAGSQPRTLKVYVGTHVGTGQLTASLSDGSSADYIQAHGDDATGNLPGIFTIDYSADSADQTLNVEFVLTNQPSINPNSNVQIFAVSLTEPPPPPTIEVPTLGQAGLLALLMLIGGAGLMILRR